MCKKYFFLSFIKRDKEIFQDIFICTLIKYLIA